ncbi:MAG: hypothetical protein HY907_05575 [Deltaproteobacteria bacterium]|nr:hypothetical protein [Deltaproteobacteria bacterium]
MASRMTRDEIERAYPGEWVVVTDHRLDPCNGVLEGVVVVHTPDRHEAHALLPAVPGDIAIWFVGEPCGEFIGFVGALR